MNQGHEHGQVPGRGDIGAERSGGPAALDEREQQTEPGPVPAVKVVVPSARWC